MENKLEGLRRLCSGNGTFADYDIFGFHYGSDAGREGWLITIWVKGRDPVNTYWLEGEEFLNPRVHYGYNFSDNILIETFGTATNMDPKKRRQFFVQSVSGKRLGNPEPKKGRVCNTCVRTALFKTSAVCAERKSNNLGGCNTVL